MAGGDILSVGR